MHHAVGDPTTLLYNWRVVCARSLARSLTLPRPVLVHAPLLMQRDSAPANSLCSWRSGSVEKCNVDAHLAYVRWNTILLEVSRLDGSRMNAYLTWSDRRAFFPPQQTCFDTDHSFARPSHRTVTVYTFPIVPTGLRCSPMLAWPNHGMPHPQKQKQKQKLLA